MTDLSNDNVKKQFAEWVIKEVTAAKNWYENTGMKVTKTPWIPPSVCIRLLREYEHFKELENNG